MENPYRSRKRLKRPEKRLKKLIALEEHTARGFLPVDYFGQIRNQLIKIISEAK